MYGELASIETTQPANSQPATPMRTKVCPFCAEEIQEAAILCRYCNRELSIPKAASTAVSATPPETAPKVASAKPTTTGRQRTFGLLAVGIGFCLTLISSGSALLGFLMMWIGSSFVLKGGRIVRWAVGFVAATILGTVGTSIGGVRPPSNTASSVGDGSATAPSMRPVQASRPSTAGPRPASTSSGSATTTTASSSPLALLASRGYESEYGGYHYVEGQVKNISDRPLKNVTVVATWYDKDGNFIKSDDAMIDYNPILPGQTSPFKSITSGNPAMAKFSVEFKTLFGATLDADDLRKKK